MILIKILLVLIPSSLAEDHETPPAPPCNCLTEYRPVCGVHNTTHTNRCIADCVGETVNCEGECPCKTCTDDTGDHQLGESWKCPDGCNTCFCMNGMILSTLMACLPIPPIELPSKACTDDTGEHQHEESWECPDGCNTCFCTDGMISSTEMACLPTELPCTDDTGVHQHEESWTCPDGCNTCFCTDGRISSTKMECHVPPILPASCVCTREWDPVCGEDEMHYSNKCMAECEGVVVKCKGRCPCPKHEHSSSVFPNLLPAGIPKRKGCSCPDKSPVCGVDGRTYPSRCQAQCEKVDIECEGECVCIKRFK